MKIREAYEGYEVGVGSEMQVPLWCLRFGAFAVTGAGIGICRSPGSGPGAATAFSHSDFSSTPSEFLSS